MDAAAQPSRPHTNSHLFSSCTRAHAFVRPKLAHPCLLNRSSHPCGRDFDTVQVRLSSSGCPLPAAADPAVYIFQSGLHQVGLAADPVEQRAHMMRSKHRRLGGLPLRRCAPVLPPARALRRWLLDSFLQGRCWCCTRGARSPVADQLGCLLFPAPSQAVIGQSYKTTHHSASQRRVGARPAHGYPGEIMAWMPPRR